MDSFLLCELLKCWSICESGSYQVGVFSPCPVLSSVKPRQCCCHQCGKSFSSIYYLKVDQKIHTGEKPYGCVQCGEKFSLMAAPKVHQRFHTEEKPYCCEHCGKRFTVKSSLVQHKKIHTGERPYCCHQCGKRFTLKTALKRHLKIHTGEKPYTAVSSVRKCSVICIIFGVKSLVHFRTIFSTHWTQPYGFSPVWIRSCILR